MATIIRVDALKALLESAGLYAVIDVRDWGEFTLEQIPGAVGPPVGTRQRAAPPLHYWLEPYDHRARSRRTGPGPTSSGWESAPKWWRAQTGRKKQPGVLTALEELLQDDTAGDPIRGVK